MPERIRIGMLTPSSNTVLEPVSTALAAAMPEVSLHFARFRVVEISLRAAALGQFDPEPMLQGAELLADAHVDAVCWNGSSVAWLGLDADRRLCGEIVARTGISANSAVLALVELFRRVGVQRYGLVSPYTSDVQERIVATFEAEGFACAAERHVGERRNFHFADIAAARVEAMMDDVAAARLQAIIVLCTNMDGATVAPAIEARYDIMVVDSIAAAMWGALRTAGADPHRLSHAGRLFAL
ncbi:MAG: Asp/Glu/hydantoin racemase [Alphaproteobacteria bacterium]